MQTNMLQLISHEANCIELQQSMQKQRVNIDICIIVYARKHLW